MADLSPIETAGLAFTAHGVPASVAEAAALDAFASLAQHREGIARVIQSCDANSEPWDDLPGYAREAFRRRADAVLAYLTGGAS